MKDGAVTVGREAFDNDCAMAESKMCGVAGEKLS